MYTPTPKKEEKGFIVASILISFFMITTIAVAVLSLSVSNNQTANSESNRVNAQFAADAGLDIGIQALNANSNWAGVGETTLYQDTKIKTTYQVTVLNGATSDKKTLKATSRVYSPATSTTPKVTRIYNLDVQAVTSGIGMTSVVSGVGGLFLNNNARITGGDVVVNGTISMNNNAQIGLSTTDYINHPEQVVNVRVAHMNCPNPVTSAYPRVCGTGENGQPISTSNNSKIYANVQATNQTTSTNMLNPGLIPNQTVAPATLPTYDRTTHPVSITKNATDSGIACPNNNGNITWPANVKIIGNVNMGNNCTITLSGNVWITGNLNTGNQGVIKIADSMGATRPVVMVDGSTGFTFANNGKVLPNASGTGLELRTFWSNDTCSPSCTNVTGSALANSQNVVTIDLGNNGNAANSVFIAQWSRVRISNNGSLGAVSGQSIELSNQAVINFTTSVPGSDNLNKTWVKRGYLRVFN